MNRRAARRCASDESNTSKAPRTAARRQVRWFRRRHLRAAILQWHHMISSTRSPDTLAAFEVNVVADGFFHVGTWLLVMAGAMTVVSWRQRRLAPN